MNIYLKLVTLYVFSLLAVSAFAVNEKTEWKLDGKLIRLKRDGAIPRLCNQDGETLVKLSDREVIDKFVRSKDQKVLLLLIMKQRESKIKIRMFDYSRLLLLSVGEEGRISAKSFLSKEDVPMNTLSRGISEVGAVSNSGSKALLEIGEADKEETPGNMTYKWKTVLLESGKVLSGGKLPPEDFEE